VVRESDIYNFVIALSVMGITMFWRKKPKDQPNQEDGASEDDAQYRWDDSKWRVPSYEHWYASNSDYQADERNYWWHQVRALWASIAIGIATLIAAVSAGLIAYWAYEATSAAVVEAQKQTVEAQNQTAQAMRQAEAAEAQIAVATDTEKRQLRAYIGVVPPADNQIANPFLPPAKPLIRLTPKNFGMTPAYRAQHLVGLGVAAYPLPKEFEYPIQRLTEPPNPITIYPGTLDIAGIIADAQRPLTPDEVKRIEDGKSARLYVWGTITYYDAFGTHHFTNFCIGFFNLTPTQVKRVPCNDHNDSD
jgi:hypothetical protein